MISHHNYFTPEEITEFKKLYLEFFGEEITNEEASELAFDFVSMLYALGKGESIDVQHNNAALVTKTLNPSKDV